MRHQHRHFGMRLCLMVILVRSSPYQLRFRRGRFLALVGRMRKINITATIAIARSRYSISSSLSRWDQSYQQTQPSEQCFSLPIF